MIKSSMRSVVPRAAFLAAGACLAGAVFNQVRPEGVEIGRSVVEQRAEAVGRLRERALQDRRRPEPRPADPAAPAGFANPGGPGQAAPAPPSQPLPGFASEDLPFQITFDQVRVLQEQGWGLFLDARPDVYYEAGHIPGAHNLPVDDYEDRILEIAPLLPLDRAIVVYCEGGDCSSSITVAQRLIQEEGYPNVHVYEGGEPEWKGAGLPMTKGPNP